MENGCRSDERHHWTTLGALVEHGVPAGDGPTLLMVGRALAVRAPQETMEEAVATFTEPAGARR